MKTFTYKAIKRNGRIFHLLTADQYPWSNLQVVTFTPAENDAALAKLHEHRGKYVGTYPGRNDFAVIQAGGSTHSVSITQENAMEVANDILTCLQEAAECWANQKGIKGLVKS